MLGTGTIGNMNMSLAMSYSIMWLIKSLSSLKQPTANTEPLPQLGFNKFLLTKSLFPKVCSVEH
jgi:hypothetical protein